MDFSISSAYFTPKSFKTILTGTKSLLVSELAFAVDYKWLIKTNLNGFPPVY